MNDPFKPGTQHGEWTVIKYDEHRGNTPYYLCQCSCGTVRSVNGYNLKYGKSTNCGCVRNRKNTERLFKDLTGQRFGRLVAIRRYEENTKQNRTQWVCKCDCGNEVVVVSNSLLTDHTLSCGCLRSKYPSIIKQFIENSYTFKINQEYYIELEYEQYGMYNIRFDIYLPEIKLAIEYDGEQHYYPVNYMGDIQKAEEKFKYTQKCDSVKNKYCEENNIKLVRIPYWERDILTQKIKEILITYNDWAKKA